MATDQIPCESCQKLPHDLLNVLEELAAKKRMRWRGKLTVRLDGSGRIVSVSSESYREIPLTKSKCPA